MQYIYRNFQNVQLSLSKVTPFNIIDLLKGFDVLKNFDILNLDIDSYDLFVIKELLQSFHPKIISMEINEKIPIPIYFTVIYDENHFWKGDHFFWLFFAGKLFSLYEELSKFDYKLYTVLYNNAIFISKNTNINFPDLSLVEFYENGYKYKKDRKDKFSYNKDVDVLLEMNGLDAVAFIDNIFKDYRGKFQLELRK